MPFDPFNRKKKYHVDKPITHNVRFKKGESAELENSNNLVLQSSLDKGDPRVICYPEDDFEYIANAMNRSDGIMFESLELDYIFKLNK